MWLDYFSQARIFGRDVSDFSWFAADSFTFVRCDMDDRANIEAAGAILPMQAIVIDDAWHASTHQQDRFLTLFPKLKSGASTSWKRPALAAARLREPSPGHHKDRRPFPDMDHRREFRHSRLETAEAFNSLAPLISGGFIYQARFDKSRRDQLLVVQKR